MNIYEKILKARKMFLNSNVKKTGQNKFQKFKYFELDDIVPTIINITDELKLCPIFNFNDGFVSLTVVNAEDPKEDLIFTSPIPDLNSENINKTIQNIGSIQTYQRRYLYMQMFDIVENDAIDSVDSPNKNKSENKPKEKPTPKPSTPKSKPKPPKRPAEEDVINDIINKEVKGKRPSPPKPKNNKPEVIDMVPLYQKLKGVNKEVDQFIISLKNPEALTKDKALMQIRKFHKTDSISDEELQKFNEILGIT